MHINQELQRAVQRFDWTSCKEHLEGVESSRLPDLLEKFVRVVIRDGYLILRHDAEQTKRARSVFVDSLAGFIKSSSVARLVDFFANGCKYAEFTESVYQSVLSAVKSDVLAHIEASQLAWFTALKAEKSLREMTSAIQMEMARREVLIDPVSAKFAVDDGGIDVNPDAVLDTLNTTLTSTFKMLAYTNRWFDANGVLVLPRFKEPESIGQADRVANALSRNYYLSNLWSQIERSDGRCRYFDGRVLEIKSEAHVTEFHFEDAGEIDLHVAGARQKRRAFSFFAELDHSPLMDGKVSDQIPVLPAPAQYVLRDEIHWTMLLSHLLYQSVVEITKEFAGLTLSEWLRGYAVIQKLAKQILSQPLAIAVIPAGSLRSTLVDHGMPEQKARIFLDRVTLSKQTKDTFDAPLVRCADKNFLLLVSMAAHLNGAFTVLSQLSQLGCNLDWKGRNLEKDVLELFDSNNLTASGVDRTIDGEHVEIDCVLAWDDFLYVFECKNYSLPSDDPQSEYWFLKEQDDAEKQVLRKVAAIEEHPELVHDCFEASVSWSTVIPIVLNGIPFSRTKSESGVCFYDASALHRFFEDGFIGMAAMHQDLSEPGIVLPEVERFYTGDSPTPAEFNRQLENPAQVVHAKKQIRRKKIEVDISDNIGIITNVIEKVPATIDEEKA